MKTKPILYSAPMVKSLLNDTKTQTRRTKGLEVINENPDDYTFVSFLIDAYHNGVAVFKNSDGKNVIVKCPYGFPGDVLWVRETWSSTVNINKQHPWPNRPHVEIEKYDDSDAVLWTAYIFRADGEWNWTDDDGFSTEQSFWKPSIYMPKAACRLWLKIKDIRVERLNIISEGDAKAEGVEKWDNVNYKIYGSDAGKTESSIKSFSTLWQSINGPDRWAANPYVWVIEFEKCDKPENF